jgi:two-component system response regulator
MHNEPTILLVDDDTNDVLLFRFALGASPLDADLRVAHSGLEAVKYLSGYGLFGNRTEFPMPGIVLLDLKMPGIDGLAVLRWIRRQRSLADLPVVVFTGAECRRKEAIELGADIYMRKGEDTGELLALLQQINLNWQRPAQVPSVVVERAKRKEAKNASVLAIDNDRGYQPILSSGNLRWAHN